MKRGKVTEMRLSTHELLNEACMALEELVKKRGGRRIRLREIADEMRRANSELEFSNSAMSWLFQTGEAIGVTKRVVNGWGLNKGWVEKMDEALKRLVVNDDAKKVSKKSATERMVERLLGNMEARLMAAIDGLKGEVGK